MFGRRDGSITLALMWFPRHRLCLVLEGESFVDCSNTGAYDINLILCHSFCTSGESMKRIFPYFKSSHLRSQTQF